MQTCTYVLNDMKLQPYNILYHNCTRARRYGQHKIKLPPYNNLYWNCTSTHTHVRNDVKLVLCTTTIKSYCTNRLGWSKENLLLWQYHCTHHCTRILATVRIDIKLFSILFQPSQPRSHNADVRNLYIEHPAAHKFHTSHDHIRYPCPRSINPRIGRSSWTDPLSIWLHQTPQLTIVLLTIQMILEASTMTIDYWSATTSAHGG